MGEAVRRMSARKKNQLFGTLFVIEGLLAMFPPVHWAMSGETPVILGLPLSVFYFIALGALISASIVAIYAVESARGELD
jgi:hypothetical protein